MKHPAGETTPTGRAARGDTVSRDERRRRIAKRPVVGWREWVALPDLGIPSIKAKVDTGARTSALHAFDIEPFERRGQAMVRFKVHPFQRDRRKTVTCEAPMLESRQVRSSSGQAADRPVIVTTLELLGERWTVEITLARRDAMGFRMLLGRQALRRLFVIDPSRSYYGGRPDRRTKRR